MNVMEVYRSVQGEGTLMGVPTTFVRFFACNLRCHWCFVPDTPILMADWSWRRLGDLQVGDVVLGIERPDTPGGHNRLVPATVERTSVRNAPTVTVNGEVRCTADHKFWLTGKDVEHRPIAAPGWRPVEDAVGMRALFAADQAAHADAGYDLGRVIEAVEPTGIEEPVVTLTTSTGSFVAGGYVVKNCDTKYSWGVRQGGTWEDVPVAELAGRIEEQAARHVVLTGGEPMLQRELPALARALRERGHHLTVETNSTLFRPELVELIDLWSLSPKLQGAGTGALRLDPLRQFMLLPAERQQWKFVITGDEDLAQLHAFLSEHPPFAEKQLPIIWQPEGRWAEKDYAHALEWLAERAQRAEWRAFNVRVLPQMHVLIWGQKRLV
ncbi:MAG TPA: radical SAM protein [Herpetosiphonaceae bacterium]|nr:radical SAM protein [Herpetosiphonaceae bacterium]